MIKWHMPPHDIHLWWYQMRQFYHLLVDFLRLNILFFPFSNVPPKEMFIRMVGMWWLGCKLCSVWLGSVRSDSPTLKLFFPHVVEANIRRTFSSENNKELDVYFNLLRSCLAVCLWIRSFYTNWAMFRNNYIMIDNFYIIMPNVPLTVDSNGMSGKLLFTASTYRLTHCNLQGNI